MQIWWDRGDGLVQPKGENSTAMSGFGCENPLGIWPSSLISSEMDLENICFTFRTSMQGQATAQASHAMA